VSEALLQTKLYIPPLRPNLVPRPQLIEQLNQGLQHGHRLSLISAPAGFGKTTLVSEWVQIMGGAMPPIAIAWLSLDGGDNDPTRLLAYLITAMQTIAANIGEGLLAVLQSPQPPPTESILTPLLNEITTIPDNFVLVLDDYHVIDAQPVDNAITFLLDHLPPQMHLVITTREDPHLPLSRLRARGQLTELRAADLRFTSSEAAVFLNQAMGLDLSTGDIAALEMRTEGWIAGLQLAAISMRGRDDAASLIKSFSGSHRLVLDYLIEEVVNQQPPNIQNFLLQTAILNRMTSPLCNAITGQDNGQATLESLEHDNLFIIPLDEERLWYRYHHLFADLLRQRLRQTQSDLVATLHHRASEWYEQNGFIDEAIEHALHAEDFERAAHLIEEQAEAIWERGEHAKLRRWLEGLPDELVLTKPHLCILQAWDLFANGQQDAAEQRLQAAERALETNTDRATESSSIEPSQLSGSVRRKIQGRAAVVRAFLAFFRGDVPKIIQYSHRALEFLPEQDLTWRSTVSIALGDAYRTEGDLVAAYKAQSEALEACKVTGDTYLVMLSNLKVAIILRMQGKLKRAIEMCQQQMQLANESGLSQTGMTGWLLAVWGETLAELNDLDEALHHAEKGIKLIKGGGNLAELTWSYMCLVRILFSRGDLAGAEEVLQEIENIARTSHVPPWITNQMAAWQARLWLAQDKLDVVFQWVEKRELTADGTFTHLDEIEFMMLARILIAQERLDEATNLLQHLLKAAEMGGRTSRAIEILILQAKVFQAGGDTIQAMVALEQALTLAEPGGFIRIFVDEGPLMETLLKRMKAEDGRIKDYVRTLLAAFTDKESHPSALSPQPLIEPLSNRELEVLHLIAEGLSNREIGLRLYLSPNTVKRHANNIYEKLNVHSRTEAVAKARTLGILD
jgi:LuxR family maltose regulon positive regulatory protein